MASSGAFDVGLPVQVFGGSSKVFLAGESVVTVAEETIQNTIDECYDTIKMFSAVKKHLEVERQLCDYMVIDKYFSFYCEWLRCIFVIC